MLYINLKLALNLERRVSVLDSLQLWICASRKRSENTASILNGSGSLTPRASPPLKILPCNRSSVCPSFSTHIFPPLV